MKTQDIEVRKALGRWKPIIYLSNLAMAYFEEPVYAHQRLFPMCPVDLPSGHFYEFSKADLARDNVHRKPDNGAVQPAIMGHSENSYSCKVDQIIIGLDQLIALAYQRSMAHRARQTRGAGAFAQSPNKLPSTKKLSSRRNFSRAAFGKTSGQARQVLIRQLRSSRNLITATPTP